MSPAIEPKTIIFPETCLFRIFRVILIIWITDIIFTRNKSLYSLYLRLFLTNSPCAIMTLSILFL